MLPTPDDGAPHDCAAVLEQVCTPRPDLLDAPLANSDMTVLGLQYVVHITLCCLVPSLNMSLLKLLRLIALTVSDLLDAILLPTAVWVSKCAAHTNSERPVAYGNARADAAAKQAANSFPVFTSLSLQAEDSLTDLQAVQTFASADEKHIWSSVGATHTDGVWMGPCVKRGDAECTHCSLVHKRVQLICTKILSVMYGLCQTQCRKSKTHLTSCTPSTRKTF